MVDVNFLMKQAKKMQERLQKQLGEMRVEAGSGGGALTIVANGHKEIVSIKINDESVLEDKEMLEDLIMAALGEVYRKVDDEMESTMKGMGGGMMPGLF